MPIDREHQEQRRKAILEILASTPAKRQLDIVRALRKQGFRLTQSSVSRDLKALGIVRVQGTYRLPAPRGDDNAIRRVEDFIIRVRSAGPYMLVFDTAAGTAKAVAVAVKAADWPEVRGILADESTLFVATENVYDTRLLLQRLKRIVGQ